MNTFHKRLRLLASAVVVAGGALLATGTTARAMTMGHPCDAEEANQALELQAIYCNNDAPPYYCGYITACYVNDEPRIEWTGGCDYYDDVEPCPINPN